MVESMSKLTLIVVAVFCAVFLLLCVAITLCICTGRSCFIFGGRHLIMARFALSAEDRRKARREALRRKLVARFKKQVKKEKKFKSTNTLDRFVKKHQVTCPICLDRYTDLSGQEPSTPPILALLMKCGHHFHLPCVWRWLDGNPTCPVCRRKVELSESEIKAVTLREIHNKEVENKSDLSSIYMIDKSGAGETVITISDGYSDSASYNSNTNSYPRRAGVVRAVTVSPRSVHISPLTLSSPTSTLSSMDNHHGIITESPRNSSGDQHEPGDDNQYDSTSSRSESTEPSQPDTVAENQSASVDDNTEEEEEEEEGEGEEEEEEEEEEEGERCQNNSESQNVSVTSSSRTSFQSQSSLGSESSDDSDEDVDNIPAMATNVVRM